MSSVMNFRDLRPEDVELRVAMARRNGVSLLIYKDARVDQAILDETVGQMNWRKSYQVIKDNLFCTIEIWDSEKSQWIAKQDCGVESNTEKEKGEASDAQKRAGFVWGIGRELYTAPFIWVSDKDCNIEEKSKGIYACKDKFSVSSMKVENKKITGLEIVNDSTGKTVFTLRPAKTQTTAKAAVKAPEPEPVKVKSAPAKKELMSVDEAMKHCIPSKNGDKQISLESMIPFYEGTEEKRTKFMDNMKEEIKKRNDHSEACLVVYRHQQELGWKGSVK